MPVVQRPLLSVSGTMPCANWKPLDENWSSSVAGEIEEVRREAAEVVALPLPDVDSRLKSGIRWGAFALALALVVAFISTLLVASLKAQLDDRQYEQECRSRISNAAHSRNLEADSNFRDLALKQRTTPGDPELPVMAVRQATLEQRVRDMLTTLRDSVAICEDNPAFIPR